MHRGTKIKRFLAHSQTIPDQQRVQYQRETLLQENETITTDQQEAFETLNNFFVKVAKTLETIQ
jgi:hypothetical protein